MNAPASLPPRRWPWILLVVVVIGILLAIAGLRREVERVKEIKALNPPRAALSAPGAVVRSGGHRQRRVALCRIADL